MSATVAVTVLSEKGVQLVEQIRRGQRKAPKAEDFFRQYTTSFSPVFPVPSNFLLSRPDFFALCL